MALHCTCVLNQFSERQFMKCCDWTGIFNNRKIIYNREWTNITYKIRVAKFQPNFLLAPKCLKKIRLLSGLATFSGAFSAAWGSMPSAFRCAWRPHLIIPFPPTKAVRYGPRSFAVAGPSTWNALPAGCTTTQRPTLPCHFVASWRLNYILEHIIHTSTLVTSFTVRVGKHNFIVLTYNVLSWQVKPYYTILLARCIRDLLNQSWFTYSRFSSGFNCCALFLLPYFIQTS